MNKKRTLNDDLKAFNVRLSKETWRFLKKTALEQERTMGEIVETCVEKYKKRLENKLTD